LTHLFFMAVLLSTRSSSACDIMIMWHQWLRLVRNGERGGEEVSESKEQGGGEKRSMGLGKQASDTYPSCTFRTYK
jgi:hypothetical protein